MADRFAINGIEPIGDDLWKASVTFVTFETIGATDVGQAANLTLRFISPMQSSVEDLLIAAHEKAKQCLDGATQIANAHSVQSLMAENTSNRSIERDAWK